MLTDKQGSDDQQSRELHRGLFRGRSAGAGGVRSVVLHVTMHEVYTLADAHCLGTKTFHLIDIGIHSRSTNLQRSQPSESFAHQARNRLWPVCSRQIPIHFKPFARYQPPDTSIAVSMICRIEGCRSWQHAREIRSHCIPVVYNLQCQHPPSTPRRPSPAAK